MLYRSIGLVLIVGTIACLRRRTSLAAFLASLDRNDALMGLALGIAFITYVFAMLMTSVASTLFLLTTSPFLAAIIGWVWIGEKPHSFTWWAMVAALIGVGVMLGDGLEMGRTAGNLVALASALAFAMVSAAGKSMRQRWHATRAQAATPAPAGTPPLGWRQRGECAQCDARRALTQQKRVQTTSHQKKKR